MKSSSTPVITVTDLRKQYRRGIFRGRIDALRGVSFEVGPGEIFGLLGPNGAGKTTVIKVVLGIIRSSGGAATLLGHAAGDRHGRRQAGYLPENLRLPRHQSARTALEYYGRLSGLAKSEIRAKSDRLIETVGLTGRDRESVKRYSKGMVQRLGLAQALLHDPKLLILDEPTDGLDPVGRSRVREILQGIRDEGRTVFLNSHLLQEVEMICDRVAILDRGKLRYVGTIAELTPDHEREIEVEITAAEDALQAALQSCGEHTIEPLGDTRHRLVVAANGQADMDRLVDNLRQHHVSIMRLFWRRQTLEDAFLRLVNQPEIQ